MSVRERTVSQIAVKRTEIDQRCFRISLVICEGQFHCQVVHLRSGEPDHILERERRHNDAFVVRDLEPHMVDPLPP